MNHWKRKLLVASEGVRCLLSEMSEGSSVSGELAECAIETTRALLSTALDNATHQRYALRSIEVDDILKMTTLKLDDLLQSMRYASSPAADLNGRTSDLALPAAQNSLDPNADLRNGSAVADRKSDLPDAIMFGAAHPDSLISDDRGNSRHLSTNEVSNTLNLGMPDRMKPGGGREEKASALAEPLFVADEMATDNVVLRREIRDLCHNNGDAEWSTDGAIAPGDVDGLLREDSDVRRGIGHLGWCRTAVEVPVTCKIEPDDAMPPEAAEVRIPPLRRSRKRPFSTATGGGLSTGGGAGGGFVAADWEADRGIDRSLIRSVDAARDLMAEIGLSTIKADADGFQYWLQRCGFADFHSGFGASGSSARGAVPNRKTSSSAMAVDGHPRIIDAKTAKKLAREAKRLAREERKAAKAAGKAAKAAKKVPGKRGRKKKPQSEGEIPKIIIRTMPKMSPRKTNNSRKSVEYEDSDAGDTKDFATLSLEPPAGEPVPRQDDGSATETEDLKPAPEPPSDDADSDYRPPFDRIKRPYKFKCKTELAESGSSSFVTGMKKPRGRPKGSKTMVRVLGGSAEERKRRKKLMKIALRAKLRLASKHAAAGRSFHSGDEGEQDDDEEDEDESKLGTGGVSSVEYDEMKSNNLRFLSYRCFICPDTSVVYPTRLLLYRHIRETHVSIGPEGHKVIRCTMCDCSKKLLRGGMKKTVLGRVLSHMVCKHGCSLPEFILPFRCDVDGCSYQAIRRNDVIHHSAKHTGIAKVSCDRCGRMMSSLTALRQHHKFSCLPASCTPQEILAVTQARERFQCDRCDKSFYGKHALERHVTKTHEGRRDFLCSHCTSTFGERRELIDHAFRLHRLNIANKPIVQCSECPFQTIMPSILRRHYGLMHTDANRPQCPICSRVCRTPWTLKRHLTSHGEKNEKCHLCAYVTARRSTLEDHIKAQHIGFQYQCDQCGYTTGYYANLCKHRRLTCKKITALGLSAVLSRGDSGAGGGNAGHERLFGHEQVGGVQGRGFADVGQGGEMEDDGRSDAAEQLMGRGAELIEGGGAGGMAGGGGTLWPMRQ